MYLYFIQIKIKISDSEHRMSLKLIQEVDTGGPAMELSRYNHLIFAYDGDRNMLEIDTKHQLLVRTILKYPPISVKCCLYQGSMQYFVTTLNKVQSLKGGLISESNSKAEFTGQLDCLGQGILLSKYHKNYRKHSINYLFQGLKKVVKLSDHPYSKLIFNPCNNQVIYSVKQTVNCFDLQQPQKQTVLLKKSSFIHDRNNLYYLTVNLENRAREEYECGIFDFRNGKNTNSWMQKDIPVKVQSFGNILTVATASDIEIYDVRKLIKPFIKEHVKGFKDFLFEPNISKLYIGCESKMKVYRTDY